jgi:hypothetical protein
MQIAEVQADVLGDVSVEEVGTNGFADVGAQINPNCRLG